MGSGIGKKVGGLLERIETLENVTSQLTQVVQGAFTQQNSKIENTDKVLMAVVEMLGKDVVSAKVEEMLRAKLQEESDKAKANLDKAIADGEVVAVDKVTAETVIVGKETSVDGVDVFPGRVQTYFGNFKPEIQALVLDKAVGDVVDLPGGGKLTVSEVYALVKKEETGTQESLPSVDVANVA